MSIYIIILDSHTIRSTCRRRGCEGHDKNAAFRKQGEGYPPDAGTELSAPRKDSEAVVEGSSIRKGSHRLRGQDAHQHGRGDLRENEEVEEMTCTTRVFGPRIGIYTIHDYHENRGVTAPEGAGFLQGITLRHPLWDVYDDHTVSGDDRQPETAVPTFEDNLEDHLTSCRAGSLGSPSDWKSRQSLGTSPLRQFCETCGSDINLSSAIMINDAGRCPS